VVDVIEQSSVVSRIVRYRMRAKPPSAPATCSRMTAIRDMRRRPDVRVLERQCAPDAPFFNTGPFLTLAGGKLASSSTSLSASEGASALLGRRSELVGGEEYAESIRNRNFLSPGVSANNIIDMHPPPSSSPFCCG